jgi:hypothetical protein
MAHKTTRPKLFALFSSYLQIFIRCVVHCFPIENSEFAPVHLILTELLSYIAFILWHPYNMLPESQVDVTSEDVLCQNSQLPIVSLIKRRLSVLEVV